MSGLGVGIRDKFTYDGEYCLKLYKELDDSAEAMNEYISYLRRHVVLRTRKAYLKRVKVDVCEDIIQSVLIELWGLAANRKFPSQSAAVYHAFINTVIRRKTAKTFAETYDDSPKKMKPHEYISETSSRLSFGDEEELRAYRTDLPEVLTKRLLDQRWDSQDRPAVEYILDTMLVHREQIREAWLKRHYGIRDPKWLIDAVHIRLREALYDLREDITYRTSSERTDILHEGLEASIS